MASAPVSMVLLEEGENDPLHGLVVLGWFHIHETSFGCTVHGGGAGRMKAGRESTRPPVADLPQKQIVGGGGDSDSDR